MGQFLQAATPGVGLGVAPLGCSCAVAAWQSLLLPLSSDTSELLMATAPDLRHGVAPLGHRPSGMGSFWLLPLTSDVGMSEFGNKELMI